MFITKRSKSMLIIQGVVTHLCIWTGTDIGTNSISLDILPI